MVEFSDNLVYGIRIGPGIKDFSVSSKITITPIQYHKNQISGCRSIYKVMLDATELFHQPDIAGNYLEVYSIDGKPIYKYGILNLKNLKIKN